MQQMCIQYIGIYLAALPHVISRGAAVVAVMWLQENVGCMAYAVCGATVDAVACCSASACICVAIPFFLGHALACAVHFLGSQAVAVNGLGTATTDMSGRTAAACALQHTISSTHSALSGRPSKTSYVTDVDFMVALLLSGICSGQCYMYALSQCSCFQTPTMKCLLPVCVAAPRT